MNTRNILSGIAFLVGEAILIAAFLLLGKDSLEDNILILNIIVSSVVYCLFFMDLFIPWINKSQTKVGSIGIRWFTIGIYSILAIAAMLVCNLELHASFSLQLIIHGGLIFLLLLGFVGTQHASDKVAQISRQESSHQKGVTEMKQAMSLLKEKMYDCPPLPEAYIQQINNLEESIRYLSPSNNPEASALEKQFIETIQELSIALPHHSTNQDDIKANIQKAERIYKKRKSIFSI